MYNPEMSKRWATHEKSKHILSIRKKYSQYAGQIKNFEGVLGPYDDQSLIKALNGSKNHANGLILFDLAYEFGGGGVIELGTNLGISSAYMASGLSEKNADDKLVTGEISGKRINIAKAIHEELGLQRIISYVLGDFKDTLDAIFAEMIDWSLCFIDGDHTYEGTLRYYEKCASTSSGSRVAVFDDIEWSAGMKRAWAMIEGSHSGHTQAIGDMGLVYWQ